MLPPGGFDTGSSGAGGGGAVSSSPLRTRYRASASARLEDLLGRRQAALAHRADLEKLALAAQASDLLRFEEGRGGGHGRGRGGGHGDAGGDRSGGLGVGSSPGHGGGGGGSGSGNDEDSGGVGGVDGGLVGELEGQLREVEDELEALQAEIDFKDMQIRNWAREGDREAPRPPQPSQQHHSQSQNQPQLGVGAAGASWVRSAALGPGDRNSDRLESRDGGLSPLGLPRERPGEWPSKPFAASHPSVEARANVSGGGLSGSDAGDAVAAAVEEHVVRPLLNQGLAALLSGAPRSTARDGGGLKRGLSRLNGGGQQQQQRRRVSRRALAAALRRCVRVLVGAAAGRAVASSSEAEAAAAALAGAEHRLLVAEGQEVRLAAALRHGEEARRVGGSQLRRAAGNLKRVRAERDQLRAFLQTLPQHHAAGTGRTVGAAQPAQSVESAATGQPASSSLVPGSSSSRLSEATGDLPTPSAVERGGGQHGWGGAGRPSTGGTGGSSGSHDRRVVRVSAKALREVTGALTPTAQSPQQHQLQNKVQHQHQHQLHQNQCTVGSTSSHAAPRDAAADAGGRASRKSSVSDAPLPPPPRGAPPPPFHPR